MGPGHEGGRVPVRLRGNRGRWRGGVAEESCPLTFYREYWGRRSMGGVIGRNRGFERKKTLRKLIDSDKD